MIFNNTQVHHITPLLQNVRVRVHQWRYGQTIYAANGERTVNKSVSTLKNNMTNNQHKNINVSLHIRWLLDTNCPENSLKLKI